MEAFLRTRGGARGRQRCPFLRRTYYGVRCVLMSPEDWKSLKRNGNHLPCWEGGNGCNVRMRVLGVGE